MENYLQIIILNCVIHVSMEIVSINGRKISKEEIIQIANIY